MKDNPIIGQGIFLNGNEVVQWIHLKVGFTPRGEGWVNQRKAGQPQCWHRLVTRVPEVSLDEVLNRVWENQLATHQQC